MSTFWQVFDVNSIPSAEIHPFLAIRLFFRKAEQSPALLTTKHTFSPSRQTPGFKKQYLQTQPTPAAATTDLVTAQGEGPRVRRFLDGRGHAHWRDLVKGAQSSFFERGQSSDSRTLVDYSVMYTWSQKSLWNFWRWKSIPTWPKAQHALVLLVKRVNVCFLDFVATWKCPPYFSNHCQILEHLSI